MEAVLKKLLNWFTFHHVDGNLSRSPVCITASCFIGIWCLQSGRSISKSITKINQSDKINSNEKDCGVGLQLVPILFTVTDFVFEHLNEIISFQIQSRTPSYSQPVAGCSLPSVSLK